MTRTRVYTCRVLDMMDDGRVDLKQLAESLLAWMSEADVREFYERYFPDED